MTALTREPSCEAGIDHRARFVDAAADRADDALDDAQQVLVVLEAQLGLFEPAFALDVDLVAAIDQDVRHRRSASSASSGPRPNSS